MLSIETNNDLGNYKDYKHNKMPEFINGDLEYRKNAFFDFCEAWDKREDPILQANPHVFSHYLHWHHLPVFEELRQYREEHGLMDALHLCILYCFTVENNTLFERLRHVPTHQFLDILLNEYNNKPLQRMDLFQLWLPSNKLDVLNYGILRQIMIRDVPFIARQFYKELKKQDNVLGMMEAKDVLIKVVQKITGWKRCSYACKNAVRHVAMAFEDLVDPNSYVRPGTGSFQGFQQVFGGQFLMSKPDEDVRKQFDELIEHPRCEEIFYDKQYLLNIEDKICFFFKYLGFVSDFRKPPNPPKNINMVLPKPGFTFIKERPHNDQINQLPISSQEDLSLLSQ